MIELLPYMYIVVVAHLSHGFVENTKLAWQVCTIIGALYGNIHASDLSVSRTTVIEEILSACMPSKKA